MKLKHLGIRKQVLYLLLACSLITLFIAGGISLYGIFDIKSDALKIGNEIGESAAENSSKALKEVSLASLQGLVYERSKQLENFFDSFSWDVTAMANTMNEYFKNPQNYVQRQVSEPRRENNGKIVTQILFMEGVNRDSLAYEIGLSANIQDLQVRLFEGDETVASNYVASVNGFFIIADSISAARVDANNNPLSFNFTERPWYKKAMQEKNLVYSDIYLDARGRGMEIACSAPYYNERGEIAGIVGEEKLAETINQIVKSTAIGKTSTAFIMNQKTGKILFSSEIGGDLGIDNDFNFENDPSLFDEKYKSLADVAKKISSGSIGMELAEVDGVEHYIAYTPIKGTEWSFGVAIEKAELTQPAEINTQIIEKTTKNFVDVLNDSIKFIILAMICAFVAVIFLASFAGRTIADKFTKPLHELSEGVREIASGNLDKKLEIHTGNEIEHLAVCFNAMTDELKTHMKNLTKVTAEREKIATELNVATNIQVSMLPRNFDFHNKNFELYAKMKAAKEVGGDFYDFYMLDENHLVVTMADVSGKGVPAALFMMMSKTILKNLITITTSPDDFSAAVRLTNDQLCQNNDAMMFVTVFVGMLDLKTGEFIFVNGGHNPPLIYKKSEDKFDYLKVAKNFVLGAMDDLDFVQQSVKLDEGDLIFLYTDGVTEAFNDAGEQYSEERLKNCLNSSDRNLSVKDLISFVRADVDRHADGAEQSDDITMLALRYDAR